MIDVGQFVQTDTATRSRDSVLETDGDSVESIHDKFRAIFSTALFRGSEMPQRHKVLEPEHQA